MAQTEPAYGNRFTGRAVKFVRGEDGKPKCVEVEAELYYCGQGKVHRDVWFVNQHGEAVLVPGWMPPCPTDNIVWHLMGKELTCKPR